MQGKADAKAAKKPVFKENYSLDRNKNKKKKPKRKSTGRKPTQNKRDLVTQAINIDADGVDREQCLRRRAQLAWRIFDGKAVDVCYHIYDLPDSTSVPVPVGLRNSRSEFGIEMILILAFLHYWIGVSLDKGPTAEHVATFILLQRELAENVDGLFVFVEHPEVEPTNNRRERHVRREAEIRTGARTSKTARGAKRRGTIVTVLASLQTRISHFTLSNVLAEIDRWLEAGSSLFEQEVQSLQLTIPPPASAR